MAVEVYIPKFGQTVEEVTLLQWLVDDGAVVKKGQEILEIETDKTTFFVESEGAGTLHRGPFEPGAVVPVLTVVATIGAPGEKFVGGMIQGEDDTVTGKQGDTVTSPAPESVTVSPSHPVKVFASPRARKLAAAEHVDLAAVTPTGGGGVRVVEKDVQAYLASAPKASPLAEKIAAAEEQRGRGAGGRRSGRPASSLQFPASSFRPPTSPSASRSRGCAASSPNAWAQACTPRLASR